MVLLPVFVMMQDNYPDISKDKGVKAGQNGKMESIC